MMLINALAVTSYVASCVVVLRKHKEHIPFFAFFSFLYAWGLVSCFYNDLGIPNIELFRFTEPTYATARLAVFGIVFNLGFMLAAFLLRNRPLKRRDYSITPHPLKLGHLKMAIGAAIVLIIFYLTYTFATEGIPVFMGIGRLSYVSQTSGLERILIIYGFPLAFLIGYFRKEQGQFSVNGLLIALFFLYAVLISNKFSFLIQLLVYYFLPIYVRHHAHHSQQRLFKVRQAVVPLVVIVLFSGYAISIYARELQQYDQALAWFAHRVLALQGQMWWAVDNDVTTYGRYDRDHWKVELDNVLSPGDAAEGEVGMQYLMVKVLGPEKAFHIIDSGYLYTGTYPAILIATLPYPVALVFQFLAGFFFLIVLHYVYYSILYRHAFRSIVAIVVLGPYAVTLVTGNFDVFFTIGMAVKILVLVALELGFGRAVKEPHKSD